MTLKEPQTRIIESVAEARAGATASNVDRNYQLLLLLILLGLYGLLSFVTIRKTKEVGIRKVLGASVSQIVSMFGREFVLLVVVAFIFAAPFCYYYMDQWLSGFAYHIDLSWWMFVSGIIITLCITLITISYQSIKAALANPVEALRSE